MGSFILLFSLLTVAPAPSTQIKVDQVGYPTRASKVALVVSARPAEAFSVRRARRLGRFSGGSRTRSTTLMPLNKSGPPPGAINSLPRVATNLCRARQVGAAPKLRRKSATTTIIFLSRHDMS
jgi:hypothetical protein